MAHKVLLYQIVLLVAFIARLDANVLVQNNNEIQPPFDSGLAESTCEFTIVESMPDKLSFNVTLDYPTKPTHEALIEMIDQSSKTLRIASFYWTMTAEPEFASDPTAEPGKKIMESIKAAVSRGVNLELVLDNSSPKSMNNPEDIKELESLGTIKYLNMRHLLKAGVMHSKFLIADNETFYVGSSNFDWRSYTQIKEIGISFTKCNVLAEDLDRIFRTYMFMSELDHIPLTLPEHLRTNINIDNPLNLKLKDFDSMLFLTGAPPAFNGIKNWTGRTDDIDGILHIIDKAEHFVDISVMNYSPRTEFIWPKKFWPRIDNALRKAASERKVRVRLLFSKWSHAKEEELMWYRSLNAVQSPELKGGGIHVKMFEVPADEFQKKIPYARVKHDKYMVTDNGLFIGTSNWSPDYFLNTCGVGVVIQPHWSSLDDGAKKNESNIISYMSSLFERDFSSGYAQEL